MNSIIKYKEIYTFNRDKRIVDNDREILLEKWLHVRDCYDPNYKPSLLEKIIAGLKLDYKKIEHPETGECFYYKMIRNKVIKIGYFFDDGDFISYNPFPIKHD